MYNFEYPLREKSIVFIGFMGVGKTMVGKKVAEKLYRTFIDIDEEIEKEYQMSVTDIFNTIGEETFRAKEKGLIKKYCQDRLKVISLGGGAFVHEDIRDVCLSNCIVFYLDISWNSWKDRLDVIIDSRPVIQERSLEEIESLFYKRKESYAMHNSKLITDQLNVEEISDNIIDSLKVSWEIYD